MNKHDFLITDKFEKNKLHCFIVSLFNEIEYINTHDVDEKTINALQENTNTVLNTINFNKINFIESENKSTYTLMTEYAKEVLKNINVHSLIIDVMIILVMHL